MFTPPYTGNHSSKLDADSAVSEASRDTPGQFPDDIYNATLPRWRAVIRTFLVNAVARESPIIARLQASPCIMPYSFADLLFPMSIGASSSFLVGQLFSLFLHARDTHILHDCAPNPVLLWFSRGW